MKITFYDNAMLSLESDDTRVLCDPWVTFDNNSQSGFYNFPKAAITREQVTAIAPNYIYITHTHPDHLDPPTLSQFDLSTPVIVSWYENNFTERMIRNLGFKDVLVAPKSGSLPLNGDDCVWIEPSAHNPDVDSIAVFRLGGTTAVNANDNPFHSGQCRHLRQVAGSIDVGLLPSGTHGPWPMFFDNLDHSEKTIHAARRAQKQKEDFAKYIGVFCPKIVVPIAGGLMCGGEKARQYEYSGIRPRSEVMTYAKENLDFEFEAVMLSEFCSYDTSTGERVGKYIEKTFATETSYIEEIANIPSLFGPEGKFYVAPTERIDLTRLMKLARKNMRRWQDRLGTSSKTIFFFDVGEDDLYRLSMADDDVTRVSEAKISDPEYEIFRLPYELLLGMITRHFVWSNVNTQHMSFHRKEMGMDSELLLYINYFQV